jgi:SET family sugar efflux transporter-like MFS transporter
VPMPDRQAASPHTHLLYITDIIGGLGDQPGTKVVRAHPFSLGEPGPPGPLIRVSQGLAEPTALKQRSYEELAEDGNDLLAPWARTRSMRGSGPAYAQELPGPEAGEQLAGGMPAPVPGRHARALAPLGVVFLATGLATALAMPFLTLFLTKEVHAGPIEVSVFLVALPVCGIAASSVMGRLSDGRFERRHILLLAALTSAVGSGLAAFLRNYWVLLVVGCTLLALGRAVMPQAFAYAHDVLAGDKAQAMMTSTLRTFFSLAWVAGPPLAAALLSTGGFGVLFGATAVLYVAVAGVAVFWLGSPRPAKGRQQAEGSPAAQVPHVSSRALWLTVGGLVVIQASMSVNVQDLPLYVVHNLHGGVGAAGGILGLCAALEIPAMLGFGYLSKRFSLRALVRLGPLIGAAYYVTACLATHVWQLTAGQILNACFIAIMGGLAISYVQQMLPTQPGRASTLYSNAFAAGAVLTGPLMGAAISHGYRLPYMVASCLTVAGFALIIAGSGPRLAAAADARTPVGQPLDVPQYVTVT